MMNTSFNACGASTSRVRSALRKWRRTSRLSLPRPMRQFQQCARRQPPVAEASQCSGQRRCGVTLFFLLLRAAEASPAVSVAPAPAVRFAPPPVAEYISRYLPGPSRQHQPCSQCLRKWQSSSGVVCRVCGASTSRVLNWEPFCCLLPSGPFGCPDLVKVLSLVSGSGSTCGMPHL